MSIKQKKIVLYMIVAAVVVTTACNDYRAVNEQNPYYQKAQTAQQNGDYDAAEGFYRECLKFSPDSSKAHLQLALIYEENKKDFPQAIVHYKAFLDAVGENADVMRMLERVEKLYMADLYRKYTLKANPPTIRPPVVTPVVSTKPSPPEAAPQTPSSRTYTVKEGDNLSTISITVYGTSKHWQKLFEENRDQLPTPEKLKVGQTLRVPTVN